MELDIWVPEKRLAFEFQGQHHYSNIYALGVEHKWTLKKDEDKRKACSNANITLIEIPYWWDFKKESLEATIYERSPELLSYIPLHFESIPKDPPTILKGNVLQ